MNNHAAQLLVKPTYSKIQSLHGVVAGDTPIGDSLSVHKLPHIWVNAQYIIGVILQKYWRNFKEVITTEDQV